MRARVKGNNNRRRVMKLLEKQGWKVGVVERTGMFINEKDLFGLFDLVALRKGKLRMIQVASNIPHTHRLFHEFSEQFRETPISIEQWVWLDRKYFDIFIYDGSQRYRMIGGD